MELVLSEELAAKINKEYWDYRRDANFGMTRTQWMKANYNIIYGARKIKRRVVDVLISETPEEMTAFLLKF